MRSARQLGGDGNFGFAEAYTSRFLSAALHEVRSSSQLVSVWENGALYVFDDRRGLGLLRVDEGAELAAGLADLAQSLRNGILCALHRVVNIIIRDLTQFLDLGLCIFHQVVGFEYGLFFVSVSQTFE